MDVTFFADHHGQIIRHLVKNTVPRVDELIWPNTSTKYLLVKLALSTIDRMKHKNYMTVFMGSICILSVEKFTSIYHPFSIIYFQNLSSSKIDSPYQGIKLLIFYLSITLFKSTSDLLTGKVLTLDKNNNYLKSFISHS